MSLTGERADWAEEEEEEEEEATSAQSTLRSNTQARRKKETGTCCAGGKVFAVRSEWDQNQRGLSEEKEKKKLRFDFSEERAVSPLARILLDP